jgi:hypothetical protein
MVSTVSSRRVFDVQTSRGQVSFSIELVELEGNLHDVDVLQTLVDNAVRSVQVSCTDPDIISPLPIKDMVQKGSEGEYVVFPDSGNFLMYNDFKSVVEALTLCDFNDNLTFKEHEDAVRYALLNERTFEGNVFTVPFNSLALMLSSLESFHHLLITALMLWSPAVRQPYR